MDKLELAGVVSGRANAKAASKVVKCDFKIIILICSIINVFLTSPFLFL
jgi:hypothetical protein